MWPNDFDDPSRSIAAGKVARERCAVVRTFEDWRNIAITLIDPDSQIVDWSLISQVSSTSSDPQITSEHSHCSSLDFPLGLLTPAVPRSHQHKHLFPQIIRKTEQL